MTSRECDKLLRPTVKDSIADNDERTNPLLDKYGEGRVNSWLGAGFHNQNLLSERVRGNIHVSYFRFGIWIGRVYKDSDHRGFRNKLVQKSQLLRLHCEAKNAHARYISARTVETLYDTKIDGISADREYYRNCLLYTSPSPRD